VEHPLIDLRLVVTLANSAMFLFGVGFFGVAMLFPSYHKAQAAIKDIEIHYGAKHPKAGAKIADGPWAPVRCFTKARCSNVLDIGPDPGRAAEAPDERPTWHAWPCRETSLGTSRSVADRADNTA
jgi:hypothetical protein